MCYVCVHAAQYSAVQVHVGRCEGMHVCVSVVA